MKTTNPSFYFLLVTIIIGSDWLKSVYGKLTGGTFANTLGGTLGKFADKNPNPWFKDFLETVAIPNSFLFGNLVQLGELAAGLCLTLIPLYLLTQKKPMRLAYALLSVGFGVGALLNATFWLAAGYTSPSTESVNYVMGLIEVIGLIYSIKLLTSKTKA